MSAWNDGSDTEFSPLLQSCQAAICGKTVAPAKQGEAEPPALDDCEEWPNTEDATDAGSEAEPRRHWCCCGYGKKQVARRRADKKPNWRKAVLFNDLWDEPDARFLDKVSCKAQIKVMTIDPKSSRFELRMHCQWKFRSQHNRERTETRFRVPGIRMPGLIVAVDESRVWRDMKKAKTCKHTVFWRGVSVFTVTGFERFEMFDFPYDRQKLSLDLLEFVWRADKDSMDHTFSMHICAFSVETESMLPEWQEAPAVIRALNATQASAQDGFDEQPPAYASRFSVMLRVERKNWYYVMQVHFLTIMITVTSCFPLCLPATKDHVNDRLGAYAGGLLTLTAFKYGVADQLPSVPYSTKFDRIMFAEMFTLVALSVEALLVYRLVEDEEADEVMSLRISAISSKTCGMAEDIGLLLIIVFWLMYWLYLAGDHLGLPFGMKPHSWERTMRTQDKQVTGIELEHADINEAVGSGLHTKQEELASLNQEILGQLSTRGVSPLRLQARRKQLEQDIVSNSGI
mmetsp:Transcript_78965/g.223473  ORF Transcript_78965/g.223473 Transcript_78965/m.223473 type:complete len:514 (+) Transcript_78965:67-1608(+)|eukprot:CAMPEP_0179273766 /NCGR_PEP_ID=MMETSP0797-20121207/33180_1 /TAXON_ID=47934 /ORGANISM="Dinophysis acuminata, Strain DAEP01" /LENGTH=513 /DNA_ID=CAMNT_0020982199 /DNA_START=67 /DNA_END=1608 /DNA_ORIENTATION=-